MESATPLKSKLEAIPPGNTLLRTVRAAFVEKGETLHAWCQRNEVDWSYAHGALTGKNSFHKAQELRQRILLDAGIPRNR